MKRLYIFILILINTLLVEIINNKSNESINKIINNLNSIDESVLYEEPSENYDITVLTKLNYDDNYCEEFALTDVNQLKTYRENVKKYYLEQNTNIVNQLHLSNYNYDISYFAPYVEIVFDDFKDYKNNKDELINNLYYNDNIENIIINYINYDETTINDSKLSTNYSLSDAFKDIGVSDLTYSGDGIKVGTIESGTPNSTANLKSDKFTRLTSRTTKHSTLVTSIIGGTSGIAEDVHFYCIGLYNNKFTNCVNKLIDDYEVNIINMSSGVNQNGIYDNYCAYIDCIVENTECTFIKSAGNNGTSDSANISSPGCGMNIITVGSISENQNVSCFSSWETSDSYLYKPDMVAPGENISDIPNISDSNSGTSFSAPMVTGIVALLMEEFPVLKINPSLTKAALHNGCNKLPSQSLDFDKYCGFGIVNYQNSRNYLSNSQYNNFIIPTNVSSGDILSSYNITIPATTEIKINVDWTINSTKVDVGDVSYTPDYTKLYLKLYDIQDKLYVKESTTDSNLLFLNFVNNSSTDKKYRIDIIVKSKKEKDGIESGSFVYNIISHTHNYDTWIALNEDYHVLKCECGSTLNNPSKHIIDGNYIGSGRYKPCAYCGIAIDTLGSEIFPIIKNNQLTYITYEKYTDDELIFAIEESGLGVISINNAEYSINGSYKLQNGIIILVEDDITTYFEGKLIFYSKDKLLN